MTDPRLIQDPDAEASAPCPCRGCPGSAGSACPCRGCPDKDAAHGWHPRRTDLAYLTEHGYDVTVTAWQARHCPSRTLAVHIVPNTEDRSDDLR